MTTHRSATAPSPWVVRFSALVAEGGRVLDVAAGEGRHSRWFAARGCSVVAVDRDSTPLQRLAAVVGIETVHSDLEAQPWPFREHAFDAIVVTHYLHRALFPHLLRALAVDGVLLYETFAHGNALYGRPSNPEFLLNDGELLAVARDALTVVAFEQGRVEGDRPAVVQRLAAVGRGRVWPPELAI